MGIVGKNLFLAHINSYVLFADHYCASANCYGLELISNHLPQVVDVHWLAFQGQSEDSAAGIAEIPFWTTGSSYAAGIAEIPFWTTGSSYVEISFSSVSRLY